MSRLRDKIPVEPLDEDRVARLERAVVAEYTRQPPARRRPRLGRLVPAFAAVAAAAAAAILAWRLAPAPATPTIDVAIAPAAPTTIVTDARGGSRIDLGDAVVAIGAASSVELSRDGSGTRVRLLEGVVDCEVEPIADRLPFVVRAGEVDVTVVGTAFRVARDGDDVDVSVTRGTVRVDALDGVHVLTAGDAWSGPATALAMTDDRPSEDDDEIEGEIGDELAIARPDDTPRPLAGRTARTPDVAPADDDAAPAYGTAAYRKRALARASVPAPNEGDPRLAGVALDASGEELSKIYRNETGDIASAAMYSHAYRLYHRGRSADALELLHRYERRFPRGAFAEDVLVMRIELLCRRAPLEACRAAGHSYLRRFPDGRFSELAGEVIYWGM